MLDQLKAQKRWFCWKFEIRPGQVDDSRADAALCAMIAFRVGPDNKALIEQVFNYSALYRDKWAQPDLITEFDPMMFSILIDHATVYPEKRIVFTFRDGREV